MSRPEIARGDAAPGSLVLTVPQAAKAVAASPRSIWRLISLGELQSVRIGRAVRVTVASIEAFIERGGSPR